MRVARTIGSVVLAIAATVSTTVAASASSEASPQNPWHRYHQPDFTVPAGVGCSFEVAAKVLKDREFYRDMSQYPNGNPHVQLWRGPLVIEFTNTSTGASVVRDVTGVATESFNRDGTFHAIRIINGHFSATLVPGSDPEQGIFYVGGHGARLVVTDDGQEVLKLGRHGTAENLCGPLAG
jgi:hypothetical protein